MVATHPLIPNWIDGREEAAVDGAAFDKFSPADGSLLSRGARSQAADVDRAVAAAKAAQPAWGNTPAVRRGEILFDVAAALRVRRADVAAIVAAETGKSLNAALGETDAAIALGLFMAGEGQRLHGRTIATRIAGRQVSTIRQPAGVAGLIVAANTPIANVAWKVFPALICGNGVVLKAAEDTPGTAALFATIAHDAGLPAGVLNVLHGLGREVGAALVANPHVDVVSFTGSTAVGREIAVVAGKRLAKVSLELGGKNPFVVCDDACLDAAAEWAVQSAFSNAGQRCASGSRIIVFASVYNEFVGRLKARTETLRVGSGDADDFGPVINERQLANMLAVLERAKAAGARVITGGYRFDDEQRRNGYFLAPTLVEDAALASELSTTELFGPIASIYQAAGYQEALALANQSDYGLTASIHTRSLDRALHFTQHVQSGVAVVNGGTFGSEPHLPFGGVKQSGNGTREPGTEAIDVYSNLKNVYLNVDESALA